MESEQNRIPEAKNNFWLILRRSWRNPMQLTPRWILSWPRNLSM